jgi:hypothetical protein
MQDTLFDTQHAGKAVGPAADAFQLSDHPPSHQSDLTRACIFGDEGRQNGNSRDSRAGLGSSGRFELAAQPYEGRSA